jgi:hypothetical protein
MPSHAVSLRATALGLERPAEDEISVRGQRGISGAALARQ